MATIDHELIRRITLSRHVSLRILKFGSPLLSEIERLLFIRTKPRMDYSGEGEFETSYLKMIWAAIASVGWYIVAIAISFWYGLPYIREKYASWKLKRDEHEYAAKYHKNPDLLQERLSAVEASRQKMQEEYYQRCMVAQQEKELKHAEKKASKQMDDNIDGHRLGNESIERSSSDDKKSKSIRGEYNPLTGDSSRGYRPPKRSCCGKGSCG